MRQKPKLPSTSPAPLAAAEILWKQGDHDGAWLELEALPPIDRVMPQVIDLRLRILRILCGVAAIGMPISCSR